MISDVFEREYKFAEKIIIDKDKEIERLKIIEEKYKDSQLYIKDFKDEIEKLNNIINELENKLLELRLTDVDGKTIVYRLLDKLQELKGSYKE